MPAYLRFEKATTRGTLVQHVAVQGKIVYQRSRLGQNKLTGRVAGGFTRSVSSFRTDAAARAKYEALVTELIGQRYMQVGGPAVQATTAKAVSKRPPKSARTLLTTGKRRSVGMTALEAFEKRHRIRLPSSYRRFVQRYGSGEFLGFVRIHAPTPSGPFRLDALARGVSARAEGEALTRPLIVKFLQGFVAFADTPGGDLLGWNLAKPAGSGEEAPVYLVERDAMRPQRVAQTFAVLVDRLAHDRRFVARLFRGLEPDPTFQMR